MFIHNTEPKPKGAIGCEVCKGTGRIFRESMPDMPRLIGDSSVSCSDCSGLGYDLGAFLKTIVSTIS